MLKILLIGPLPEPTTGVSLSNKVVVDGLKESEGFKLDVINTSLGKFDEDLGTFSIRKICFYLKINLHIHKLLKSKIVYITPGQTFFGLAKYSLFICLSRLLKKEVVIHVHGNYLGKEYMSLKGIKKRIFAYLLKNTTKGIVLSESLTGNMSPFINRKDIHILYNFVEDDLFKFRFSAIEEKLNFEKPRILFLSNLMKEKGIIELLECLKTLEKSTFPYEAKIAGNIDRKNEHRVQEYFKELESTEYVGVVSGKKKRDLLLWSNIFILPTYYKMEGQPISILEAMATGNIVLTTNHAGIPDIFSDKKNGFFIEKRDTLSIVDSLNYIVENKRISNDIILENYKTAKQKYGVSNFINGIKSIFEA